MGDMRPRRESSLRASFFTSSGMPASSILLAQLFDLALALVLLAELLLDGLHLLAKVVIALRLLNLVLDFVLDFGAELLDLNLLGQVGIDQFEPGGDAGGFQQKLLVIRSQERQRGGDKIDQAAGLLDVGGDGAQLVGEGGRLGYDLLELADDDADQGLDAVVGLGLNVFERFDLGNHERLSLDEPDQADSLHAFGEDEAALVGHADHLVDGGQGSDSVHVVGGGGIQARILLSGDRDGAFVSQGFDQLDGAFAANGKWQNSMGKQDGIPHRQDRDCARVFPADLLAAGGVMGFWLGIECPRINFSYIRERSIPKVSSLPDDSLVIDCGNSPGNLYATVWRGVPSIRSIVHPLPMPGDAGWVRGNSRFSPSAQAAGSGALNALSATPT